MVTITCFWGQYYAFFKRGYHCFNSSRGHIFKKLAHTNQTFKCCQLVMELLDWMLSQQTTVVTWHYDINLSTCQHSLWCLPTHRHRARLEDSILVKFRHNVAKKIVIIQSYVFLQPGSTQIMFWLLCETHISIPGNTAVSSTPAKSLKLKDFSSFPGILGNFSTESINNNNSKTSCAQGSPQNKRFINLTIGKAY